MVGAARAQSRVLLQAVFCLAILLGCTGQSPVRCQNDQYPVGLVVEYDIDSYLFAGTERFEVLSWATGPDHNLASVKITTTGDTATTETLFIDFTIWDSSYVIPPILVDFSNWQVGQTVAIPSRSRTYELSMTTVTVPEGTYSCWWANYYSFDEASWSSTGEAMAYERALGVLLYWSDSYFTMGGGFEDSASATLRSSNMAQFGRPTLESSLLLGLLVTLVSVSVCVVLISRFRRSKRLSRLSAAYHPEEQRVRTEPIAEQSQPLAVEGPQPVEEPSAPPMAGKGPRCIVCSYPIKPGEAALACPHCGARAHRSHFLEWIKIKRTCPKCQQPLEPSDLEKQRPSGRSAPGSRRSVPTS
jgi:predicted RNA-binding Zn-ribbon protein involved in translation (DUF1610 family)